MPFNKYDRVKDIKPIVPICGLDVWGIFINLVSNSKLGTPVKLLSRKPSF
jgi:hypothetical protein